MATLIGKESGVGSMLLHLIELDFDAISAYEAALERLESPLYQGLMRRFLLEHQRHVQELSQVIRDMGGRPPTGADAKGILTTGRVVIGHLAGDVGILSAMRTNEEDPCTAYARAAARLDVPPPLRSTLARFLTDERNHRATLVETLEQAPCRSGAGHILPVDVDVGVGVDLVAERKAS